MERNEAIERTKHNLDVLPGRLDNLEERNLWSLEDVKEPCICIGSGGSDAASYYASKILAKKNNIICSSEFPRNVLYKDDLKHFRNLLAITYSNNNHAINEAIKYASNFGINSYILTVNPEERQNSKLINYIDSHDKEKSFISIASTFEPMATMYQYYSGRDCYGKFAHEELAEYCERELKKQSNVDFNEMLPIEIMSGDNTYTAAKLLNSTILEAALGIPVMHEKDNYRHGCSSLSWHCKKEKKDNVMIYLLNGRPTEIDELLLNEIADSYKYFILLKTEASDVVAAEFDLAVQAMFLCQSIAIAQNKGLSKVEYNPAVKKLYYYKGKL